MEKRQVTRFYAVCEKEYRTVAGAKAHERVCKCFTNPKFRACNTCKHNNGVVKDGDEYQSWAYVDCIHPTSQEIDFDKFKIPNSTISSCVNCPSWENDNYKGEFEVRVFAEKKPIEICKHEYIAGYAYSHDSHGVANPENYLGDFCKNCGAKKDTLPF
jgi:hypothetical protein